jgi:hypothetical protein
MNARSALPHVVLVHGGFADGSGWRGVYDGPQPPILR